MATQNMRLAEEALARYGEELMALPGVVSVAAGRRERDGDETSEAVVTVFVVEKLAPADLGSAICPGQLHLPGGETVGTDVIELGGYPMAEQIDTTRYRPVVGGSSMGPTAFVSAGTLGGVFCTSNAERPSTVEPVWLTNTHVVSRNLTGIPADDRVVQPARNDGGNAADDTIGRTTQITAINTTTNPATAPNNVIDAAIGTFLDEIDYEARVEDIGPAPFELGTPAMNTNVQKRGRRTRLTNGQIRGTGVLVTVNYGTALSPIFGAFPAASQVFLVRGGVLPNRWSNAGDSGSLVFARASGRLQNTVPCLGLHFAGRVDTNNRSWGWAFDINVVVNQLQLDLLCTCVARAILAAIFGATEGATRESIGFAVRRADSMMRSFRHRVLKASRTGRVITEAVEQIAPDAANVLMSDPESFDLAVELLSPWVTAATSVRVLNKELDEATVVAAERLAARVTRLAPSIGEQLDPLASLMRDHQGQPVRKLVGRLGKRTD